MSSSAVTPLPASAQAGHDVGRQIAYYRTRRALSQRDFAAMIDRSESWVSQVERGVRQIDRLSVLRTVAHALHVPLCDLVGDASLVTESPSAPESTRVLRALLSTIGTPRSGETPYDTRSLTDQLGDVSLALSAARYSALAATLPELVTRLVAAAASDDPANAVALCQAYMACAITLVRLGDTAAAWMAADRAVTHAEGLDTVTRLEAASCLSFALFEDGRHAEADQVARTFLDMTGTADVGDHADLRAGLWLRRARAAARQSDAGGCHAAINHARLLMPAHSETRGRIIRLGPVDVRLCEVATAFDLGGADRALRLACDVDDAALSQAQAVHMKLVVARAYLLKRDKAGVLSTLLQAEHHAPEYVRTHAWVRTAIRQLIHGTREPSATLSGLAQRCGASLVDGRNRFAS